jgi:hypothetical protein
MSQPVDKFVRRQNVEHYRRLLETLTDDHQREVVLKLLPAERKPAQKDAADS